MWYYTYSYQMKHSHHREIIIGHREIIKIASLE